MKVVCRNLVALCFIICAGLVAYSNTYTGTFHFDDYPYIAHNANIKDLGDVASIWKAGSRPVRFLSYLSFAINYHIHGEDVFGYHLVNTGIHVVNGMLVFWFILLLLKTPYNRLRVQKSQRYALALTSALLFTAHPIQTEAVTYIVQRFTSLAALFYLASLCGYLKFRLQNQHKGWFVFSLSMMVASMFTKQISFTLPIMMLIVEFFFIREKGKRISRAWFVVPLLFLLLIPALLHFDFAGIFGREYPSRSHTGDQINILTYPLTQFRVLWRYLWLFIVPLGQTLDYDFSVSTSFWDGRVLLSVAALIAIMVVMVLKYKTSRLAVFAGVWFFVTISITTSIVPIPQVIFEHRCYLPSVGMFLILSLLLQKGVQKPKHFCVAVVLIVSVLIFLTLQRNRVWQNNASLWEDIIQKAPEKLRGYNNLGVGYFEEGLYEESVRVFSKAIEMNPHAARAYSNRGLAYSAMGRDDLALADYNMAIKVYQTSMDPLTKKRSLRYVWAEMFHNRGKLYRRHKKYALALKDYQKAVELDPKNESVYYNIGSVFEELLRLDQALLNYQKAAQLAPQYAEAHNSVGIMYHALGEFEKAIASFSRAVHIEPQQPMYYYYRSLSFYQKGDLMSARADLEESMRLGYVPDDPRLKEVFQEILQNRG